MAAKAAAAKVASEFGVKVGSVLASRAAESLLGTGRAARSTDVYIVNLLSEDLILVNAPQPKENRSGSGIWTSSMLPPHTVEAKSVEAYGCESHGFMTGATNATATYRGAKSGTIYSFTTSNPFFGRNSASASNFNVTTVVGGGNNNTVRFIVRGS